MMDNSDMELSPTSQSNNSSRSSTPKPEKPLSDCERRRNAMERLNKQYIMIDGYKKYLDFSKHLKDETGIRNDMEKHLKETMEARDLLVSELRTMPPCLNTNCPGHSILETKNSAPKKATENNKINDSDKNPLRKEKHQK
ncbi:uncharacterized protein TNCV_3806021 [Trichonephila clavipes]|nr:uncharacterized protein TNCV_3806021 [Trichonephila clavipes]